MANPAFKHNHRCLVFLGPSKDDVTASIAGLVGQLARSQPRRRLIAIATHAETGLLLTGRLVEDLQAAGWEVVLVDLADSDIRPDLAILRNIVSSLVDKNKCSEER